AGGGPGGGGEGGGGGGRPSIDTIRERLVKGLGLSEEQQKKLEPILQDSRQQMIALRGAPDGERQAKSQQIREKTRTRIREILAPPQQAKYDEMSPPGGGGGRGTGRAATSGRVWIVGPDGKPSAVTL